MYAIRSYYAFDVRKRIDMVLVLLKKELEVSRLQSKISKNIEEKVSAQQREFFLREQLKAIKKELGLEKEGNVITSYSIHYTKLYDRRTSGRRQGLRQAASRPASRGGRLR